MSSRALSGDLVVESVSEAAWTSIRALFLDDSYQQSPAYAAAAGARHGARREHVVIRDGEQILGAATVRVRRLPMLGGGIAYVSAGPLVRRGMPDDALRLERCLDALDRAYVAERGLVLRVLAPIGPPEWNAVQAQVLCERGMAPTDQSRRYQTMLLDLSGTSEEALARCSKNWRRNLRRARGRGFSVRTTWDARGLDALCSLYDGLTERKGLQTALDARFYADLQGRLPVEERMDLIVVEDKEAARAAILFSCRGDTAVPLVFAADLDGMRGYASYLAQWSSVEVACARGMRYYDVGGIDPKGNPGVYDFKRGMRGVEVIAAGPAEATPPALRAWLVQGAERVYRAARRAA